MKSKYEFLGKVIQKYINPGVLRFVVATRQYEYMQKQFVNQYRGLTKITLLSAIQFNMADYDYRFARLQQQLPNVQFYPLLSVLNITNPLALSVLLMKINAENVVIVQDHTVAPRLLEVMHELTVIACDTGSLIRMTGDNTMTASKLRNYKFSMHGVGSSQLYVHSSKNMEQIQQDIFQLEHEQADI